MDQVQALLTAASQQMGGILADALKNIKRGNDNQDFTIVVEVEVQHLKDDQHVKVSGHILLVISMVTLRGIGHAFELVIHQDLPAKHSNKYGLDFSDLKHCKNYKTIQANNNAMTGMMMVFLLPKHQHEIDASHTAQYSQGVAHEAIRHLKAQVIPAKEMAATVPQAKLDVIKMKETDHPQQVDDKSSELARLYMASGSTLTATMKKTQLMKITPLLYSGCINTAN